LGQPEIFIRQIFPKKAFDFLMRFSAEFHNIKEKAVIL
jgi:hypothetical protein